MVSCKSVYQPREDSTMLERYVRQYAKGKVLDVGTGSGIQAIAAAQSNKVGSVLATDVQRGVIEYCKRCIKNKKIRFLQSDLFENVRGKFDTIIFNPPYLPQEFKLKDLTIEGGKKGYEVIERFLNEVNGFLNFRGFILMVFSSLTKKEKVEEFIKNNLLDFEELEKRHIFFEDIHAYLLRKNEFLKTLEDKGIKNIKYFTKGHRGLLFTGIYKNKKVAIKTKNPQSKATGRIKNEANWLKKLNKFGIGPGLLMENDDFFVSGFIEGKLIVQFIKKSNVSQVKKIIRRTFDQLFILDKLKVDKEEMHQPIKHIIVCKNKPYLIDFERAHYSRHPKNVTQFCQFLMSGYLAQILANKRVLINQQELIGLAKIYKRCPNIKNLKRILDYVA